MKTPLLALAASVAFAGMLSSQTPQFVLYDSNQDFAPSNVYTLQTNRPPTTVWFKTVLINRQYDWNRMRVVGVFGTKLLAQPMALPGIGSLEIDPASFLHVDLSMPTRFVGNRPTGSAEIVTWTVFPRLSSNLIGTKFYGQFVAYESSSSNPRWTMTRAYPYQRDVYSWVILPG